MSEYANYSINGVNVYSLSNEAAAAPFLMEAFAPGDWVDIPKDDSSGDLGYLGYRTTCGFAKQRLDVQGFTFEKCLSRILAAVGKKRQLIENPLDEYGEDDIARLFKDEELRPIRWNELFPVLENTNALLDACKQVLNDRVATEAMWFPEFSDEGDVVEPANALAARLLSEHCADVFDAWPFDFDDCDSIDVLRILVESADEEWVIEYDCTLPMRCWSEGMTEELTEHLNKTAFSSAAKIIVLTEGVSDDKILSASLMLLRPEIAHLFKFFDYHSPVQAQRGAAELARFAKSIISVGLQEKIIFLFDNDAVGIAGYKSLPDQLPANMKKMHLPNLEVAKDYPTFGPDGDSASDLNGRAVAIEFFLGDNALNIEDGERRIVRWKECHAGVYQGSFDEHDKQAIQRIFVEAVEDAKEKGLEQSQHDWKPMEGLLDLLVQEASGLTTDLRNW